MKTKERKIKEEMKDALLRGALKPLLDAVKADDTLEMELRGESVNIYYRGGSVFKITENKNKKEKIRKPFILECSETYCNAGGMQLDPKPDVTEAVAKLPMYKQGIDWTFSKKHSYEREFQQVIARENNNHGNLSRGTDYYIADIEYVDSVQDVNAEKGKRNFRFDMVALKWLSTGAARKDSTKVSPALIEVKYGDGALKGDAGIPKHLEDFSAFLGDKDKLESFCEDMKAVFKQKCELGLVDGLTEKQWKEIQISTEHPEVIFIFANHDPDSKILSQIAGSIQTANYSFPIYVAEASHMGYCLYAKNLRTIDSFAE